MTRRRHTFALAVALVVLGAGRAAAETFLVMQSPQGDYAGIGQTIRLTANDIDFSVDAARDVVYVKLGDRGTEWTLAFAAPRGVPLVPGPYEDVQRLTVGSPTKPSMSISGQGRGCSRISGRFVVLEIAFGDRGLTRFAAEFAQYCNANAAPLYGIVSYGTDLPVPRLPNEPVVDPALTYLLLDGDADDYVSDGRRLRFSADEGSLTVTRLPGALRASVTDESGTLGWDFTLAAPLGGEISSGVYLGARRYPLQAEGVPGLDVSGNGRSCGAVLGRFVVHQFDVGPDNAVTRVAADLEQHCGGDAAALRASIRVNSPLPPGFCAGDCDGDRTVTVAEAITGVNALLDQETVACGALDSDGDGRITVDAVIRAVIAALDGCIGPSAE